MQARGGPLTFRYWDDAVRGGGGSSKQGKWLLRLVERGKQIHGKGIDTRRAESFKACWTELERYDCTGGSIWGQRKMGLFITSINRWEESGRRN